MLNNLLDDLIQTPQQPAAKPAPAMELGGLLDDLIEQNTATPPQGQASAPPAVAVNSGLGGGAAPRTVLDFPAPPVMDPMGINKPVDSEVQRLAKRYPAPPAPPGFFGRMGQSFGTGVEQGKTAISAITATAQDDLTKRTQQRLTALEATGQGASPEATGLRTTLGFYQQRQGRMVGDLAARQATMADQPIYPGVRALGEAESFGAALDVLKQDPLNIIANLGAQSLPTMLPGLAVGMVNPLAGALTMGASGSGVELGSSLLQYAQENGVNTRDSESLRQFYADPAKLEAAKTFAATRAGVIGVVDAASAGVAGKMLVPRGMVNPVARAVTNTAVQIPTQAAAGAGGEAAAQLATEGRITNPGEVVAEGAGGLFTAPLEVASMATGAARAEREPTAPPPVPPPPRERIDPTMGNLLDDLIPAGNANAPQDPAVAPAVIPTAPPSAPAAEPDPAITAANPVAPAEPTQPEPSAALTAPPAQPGDVPETNFGNTQRVSTVTGRQIDTRLRVVDASELQAASGDLQPRDRSRASSDEQINAIASQLDPQRLGSSAEADRGAPIMGPDMIVESGNGRVAAIRRAFEMFPEKAQAYRDYLAAQGFDTTGVAMPVLVRERVTPLSDQERIAFVQEANQASTMALSPVEVAQIDVSALQDSVVDMWVGGDVSDAANRDFVRAFIGQLPQTQRNGLLDDNGGLSPDGAIRIRRALLAAAYGDRELLSKLVESGDDNIKSIGNALFDVSGQWLQMRRMARDGIIEQLYDVTPQLVQAARVVDQLRQTRGRVQEWLAQTDLTGERDPVVDSFVTAFYNEGLTRAVGRDAIGEVLRAYVAMAKSQDTAGLFGDAPPAPGEMVQGAVTQRNARNKEPENGKLFDAEVTADPVNRQPQGDDAAGQGIQPGGRQAQSAVVQGSGTRADRGGAEGGDAGTQGRGSAPRQERQGAGNQTQAGGVDERASGSDGDDAGASEASGERSRRDNAPAQNQRVKGSGAESVFNKVSFTDRQSIYRDAFVELGFDPAEAELLPPVRQLEILSRGLRDTYGLKFVQKSARANIRDSIDQLLDAYRGLQLMTHVLDLPTSAIGLRGTLGLAMTSQGKYLGAYYPAGTGDGASADGVQTITPTIAMPGRSNSFAHEWGHALDYFVLSNYEGVVSDLSGFIRKGETLSNQTPETVRDSFRLLMNSLFFDQAEQSAKIMDLERRIEAAALRGIDATRLKADLEQVKSGASQSRSGRSQFFEAAGDFARSQGGDPAYWQNPTEMLARSFEAYVAHRIEAAGGSTEFVGKGDAAYLSTADERLAKTFPKDADRFNIFRAYDLLFDAIRAEALLNPNNEASAGLPGNVRLSDPAVYFDDQRQSAQTPAFKLAWSEEKRAWAVRKRELEKLKARPNDDRPLLKRMGDAVRAIIETNRGVLLSMEAHYAKTGNNAAASALRQIIERLATDPGSGRKTGEGGTFAESVDRETKRFLTRLSNIRGNNDGDLMTDAELTQLANVLTQIGSEAQASAGTRVNKMAAPLRELLTDLYYYNRNAGLDIGFVQEQGYLPRLLDEPVVTANAPEFIQDATEVYRIVFERDTERPGDADDITVALAALDKRAREAMVGKDDPNMGDYKAAKKQLRKLMRILDEVTQEGESDKIDAANAAIQEFLDDNKDVFEAAYDYVRDVWSASAAAEYQTRISYGSPEGFDSHSPAGSFLKGRTLPPEADKILAKYYIQDPVERITSYIQMSVRKAEYNTRFGKDARDSREKQTKLFTALEQMVGAGVRKEDRDMVEKIVGQVTGTDRSSMPHQAQRTLGNLHALGQMTLLGRVVLTSLAEPITVAVQTGKPLDSLKAVGLTIQEIANTGSVRERRAMARVLGLVSGDYADEMISNRLGGSFAESSAMSRVTANYFRRVGLTGLTNAQRRAAMQLSGRYVLELAHTLDDADASAASKGYARAELLDAGIQPEQIQDFVNWTREFSGRMPRHDELIDVDGSLTEMGKIYAVMVGRLVNQSIQNPTAIDRPWAANTPIGRLTYGLLSFSMAFFRNVMVKSIKKIGREYEQRGASQAAYVAGVQVLAPLATLYSGHLLVTVAREALLNPDKWEEEEEKEGGFPIKWLSALAFSRVGFTGLADPLYNALLGVKYQRDLSNILAGASPSYFLQALERIAKYFVVNSENTNSAERNASRGLYEVAVQPSLAYATGYLPGGPMVGYGLGASYMYFSSPAFKSQWQDWMAGEKQDGQKKTGSGQKESPL